MTSTKDNIEQMMVKVKEGLQVARSAAISKEQLDTCDILENAFDKTAGNLLIMSVGLSAMRFRTPEQIRMQLNEYSDGFKKGKDLASKTFIPNTNLMM